MPNCFQLLRNGNAVSLQQIDDEMRIAFNAPSSDSEWYLGWYDVIGLYLACGKDWDWIEQHLSDSRIPVAKWLRENFQVACWAER